MKSGTCPKCNAIDIYTSQNGIGSAECHYLKQSFGWSPTDMETYLCASCGYFENYLSNRTHLGKVRRSSGWSRL